MTTGEKIAGLRKKCALTQIQLAEALGVTRQAVSRWEGDLVFPETDTLIKMSKLFGCTVDYLLNYNGSPDSAVAPATETINSTTAEPQGAPNENAPNATPAPRAVWSVNLGAFTFEYKSKAHVGNIPLVHVNWGPGRTAKGIFAFGLKSVGVFSFGIFSLGFLSFGVFALGLIGLGVFALGLLAAGSVAVGLIALGALAVGLYAMGACSFGLFACGAFACGHYVAIGDVAVGGIALGNTRANGSRLSVLWQDLKINAEIVNRQLNEIPQGWAIFTEWCRALFESIANGVINIKVKI